MAVRPQQRHRNARAICLARTLARASDFRMARLIQLIAIIVKARSRSVSKLISSLVSRSNSLKKPITNIFNLTSTKSILTRKQA
jgi:hypothetical protein